MVIQYLDKMAKFTPNAVFITILVEIIYDRLKLVVVFVRRIAFLVGSSWEGSIHLYAYFCISNGSSLKHVNVFRTWWRGPAGRISGVGFQR